MNNLFVYGDSFSMGSGLENLQAKSGQARWDILVKNHYGLRLRNFASGGGTQQHIFYRLARTLHLIQPNDIVVIGLSDPCRYQAYDLTGESWFHVNTGILDSVNDCSHEEEHKKYLLYRNDALRPYWEQHLRTTKGIHKLIKQKGAKSISWSWRDWGDDNFFMKEDNQYPTIHSEIENHDFHWNYTGHFNFAGNLISQLDAGVVEWYNIFKLIKKAI